MEADDRAGVDVTRLFTTAALWPVQVVHPPADRWLWRLCLAVLEDALKCLGIYGGYGGPVARARYQREAWEWVLSDAEYCFSFATVCSVLHLDGEAVRNQLRHRYAPSSPPQPGVSRRLRQPLVHAPSTRSAQRTTVKTGEVTRGAGRRKAATPPQGRAKKKSRRE